MLTFVSDAHFSQMTHFEVQMKSIIVGGLLRVVVIVIIVIARLGATLGKVMFAQTLVRRTWWDFNMLAFANGKRAFLIIATK